MIIMLVGPSRAGKSSLGSAACRRIDGSRFYELDVLVSHRLEAGNAMEVYNFFGQGGFLSLCKWEVEMIRQADRVEPKLRLVDVGAGAQHAPGAIVWLNSFTTIAVLASPHDLEQRVHDTNAPETQNHEGSPDRRTAEDFQAADYSTGRRAIYEKAVRQFHNEGLDLATAKEEFTDLIVDLWKA